jgi:hypothetical protein
MACEGCARRREKIKRTMEKLLKRKESGKRNSERNQKTVVSD